MKGYFLLRLITNRRFLELTNFAARRMMPKLAVKRKTIRVNHFTSFSSTKFLLFDLNLGIQVNQVPGCTTTLDHPHVCDSCDDPSARFGDRNLMIVSRETNMITPLIPDRPCSVRFPKINICDCNEMVLHSETYQNTVSKPQMTFLVAPASTLQFIPRPSYIVFFDFIYPLPREWRPTECRSGDVHDLIRDVTKSSILVHGTRYIQ